MPRRALLKFRNADSTQDINDRFRGLFDKGFFSGGQLTAVPGVLKVDLGPFATVGSDGMFVREDSETTRLDVVANFKNYIVIRQEYIVNADPVVSVESLTEPEFLSEPDPDVIIVFGVVNVPSGATATTSTMIETFESNIVDPGGRLEFRGLLSTELDLPGAGFNENRAGDFYIITAGTGDQPNIFAWNGLNWINITNAAIVASDLLAHRTNVNSFGDELHLTDLQAEAVAGSEGIPSDTNRFVTETDNKVLTDDQADAAEGNYVGVGVTLEDFPPSDSNRFVSSSKVFAVPTEEEITVGTPTNSIEIPNAFGGVYVGIPSDPESTTAAVLQWFNIYTPGLDEDTEFVNGDSQAVNVVAVQTGPPGGPTDGFDVNPQTPGTTDDLGFFVNPTLSLFLITDNPVDSDVRVSYGKRTSLGTLLPHLLMDRGPKGGQIDTKLLRLLFGTPNAHFEDPTVFDGSVANGAVVAFNTTTSKFVNADPNAGLYPVGVRGNFNNLIMEGLYTADVGNPFSVDFLYADKTSPGSLTNTANEWFIGRAISSTQLLVNMNQIPLLASGEVVPPVPFDVSLFDGAVQPGDPVAWNGVLFVHADSDNPALLPLGIRGNSNNVIQNGKYSAMTSTPYTSNVRYYAGGGASAGTLVPTENDWFIGIGIDSVTLLVNANAVAIPHEWPEEHDSLTGYHKFKIGDAVVETNVPAPVVGMLFIRDDTDPPRIDYWNGASWDLATSGRIDVPSGSKMLFMQDSVPTGWTLDVATNDTVVRITDTEALGGVTGGSWTITGFNADSHILDVTEIPAHDHGIHGSGGADENYGYNANGPTSGAWFTGAGRNTEMSTGGGAGHTHIVSNDGNWRPSYINAIICIRD